MARTERETSRTRFSRASAGCRAPPQIARRTLRGSPAWSDATPWSRSASSDCPGVPLLSPALPGGLLGRTLTVAVVARRLVRRALALTDATQAPVRRTLTVTVATRRLVRRALAVTVATRRLVRRSPDRHRRGPVPGPRALALTVATRRLLRRPADVSRVRRARRVRLAVPGALAHADGLERVGHHRAHALADRGRELAAGTPSRTAAAAAVPPSANAAATVPPITYRADAATPTAGQRDHGSDLVRSVPRRRLVERARWLEEQLRARGSAPEPARATCPQVARDLGEGSVGSVSPPVRR